jgi:integrase
MAASTLKRVLAGLGVQRVRDLERHLVIAWRVKRLAAKATPMMVNGDISVLQAMLRWATDNGMIKENPIAGLKRVPIPKDLVRRKRRALSEEEIVRLYAAAEEDDRAIEAHYRAEKTIEGGTKGREWNRQPRVQRVPQAVLWRAFIETGARHGELVHTTWQDLDVPNRTLTLRAETTKTAKERVIPLREDLVQRLWDLRRAHLRVRRRRPIKSDHIFLSPEGLDWNLTSKSALRILRRVLERAGIPHRTERGEIVDVHSLRHTCASRLARSGVGLLQAQRILGHADVRMTAQVYSHLGLDDLRAAVEKVAEANAQPPTLTLLKPTGAGVRTG